MANAAPSSPLKLIARLVLATALMLWICNRFEEPIIKSAIPALRWALNFVGNDFKVLELDIAQEGPNQTLRLRADFANPIVVSDHVLYPLNTDSTVNGWFQVNLTIGGLLQYVLLLLSIVIAWPVKTFREGIVRLLFTLPTVLLFAAINCVSTLLAELWGPVHTQIASDEVWPLLVWSKFLMGGGGIMLAICLAGAIILIAMRFGTDTIRKTAGPTVKQHIASSSEKVASTN
jgi:hypothetical protein